MESRRPLVLLILRMLTPLIVDMESCLLPAVSVAGGRHLTFKGLPDNSRKKTTGVFL
jgi:hypothetical protein